MAKKDTAKFVLGKQNTRHLYWIRLLCDMLHRDTMLLHQSQRYDHRIITSVL